MEQSKPLFELRNATVRFGSLTALDSVTFRMFPGEVHSLMGENGAGKSTLIKAMTGVLPLESGTLLLDGDPVTFPMPQAAQRAGVLTVSQEIDLLENLSVAENIWLGREPRRFGLIDYRAMKRLTREVLQDLGMDIDPASLLGSHSLAVQQLVAIARAISADVRVLVLDEPTSSLDTDEVAELFRVIRDFKERGVAVLFVSHFLDQVYEICDRVTVVKDGAVVGEYLAPELLRIDLVQKMLGRDVADFAARGPLFEPELPANPFLSARGITNAPGISDADVDVAAGEVLGLAGLLGSGRTELARCLTGIDRPKAGILRIDDRLERWRSPRHALNRGVVHSPENRRTEGLISEFSIQDNIVLAVQAQQGVMRRIPQSRRRELAASWIEALGIRPSEPDSPVSALSGGNQQKVMLARLLALSPRVLVLDEPTRGVDVGARAQIQNLVRDLADNGLAVVFISAELEEVLRVGDRVAVLRNGEIAETLAADSLTLDTLLALVAQPDLPEA